MKIIALACALLFAAPAVADERLGTLGAKQSFIINVLNVVKNDTGNHLFCCENCYRIEDGKELPVDIKGHSMWCKEDKERYDAR